MSIKWVNEPPPRRSRGKSGVYIELLTPMMEFPNRWAIIATRPSAQSAWNVVSQLRSGRVKRPEGRWEFESRGLDVYATYIGPASNGTLNQRRIP